MIMRGRGHVLGDFLNTDIHFTNKYKYEGQGIDFLARHILEDLDPSYSERIRPGDFLIGGTNFGASSSREQAVKVMRRAGISAVLAQSFSRLFYRNALNNGLYTFQCDTAQIQDGDLLEIDPAAGKIAVPDRGIVMEIPPLPPFVERLVADGGLLSYLKAHPDWE